MSDYMKQNSIIKWMDAIKLAIGIMIGLTSTLLIINRCIENGIKMNRSLIMWKEIVKIQLLGYI